MKRMTRFAAAIAVGALTITSLIAGSGAASAAAPTKWGPPDLGPRICSVLKYVKVPRVLIGLPTGGAYVESATWNAAGAYCSVIGWIRPATAGSPSMQFQVNLPRNWNGRALQFGGGGYDGTLVTGLGTYTAQPVGQAAPIDQGYVTLGSDGGHQGGPGFDGTFGLNDEALRNYGQESVKKAHDAAMVLIAAAYWKKPSYFYFIGGSQGGHEALDAAARYPKDYDGVVANYPAYNVTMMHEGAVNFRDALYADGGAGWLSPAKTALITDAVYAACDGLDGLEDGLIGNIGGCNDTFDPTVLVCPSGEDEGDGCLSDAQFASAQKIATDYDLGFEIAGNSIFAKSALFEGALYQGFAGFGADPIPSNPIDGSEALQYIVFDQTSKYIVTRDPALDSMTYDLDDWVPRIQEVGTIMDVTDVSLERYRAGGGKIILTHGTVDDFITPHNTIQYYERQVAQFGAEKLSSFLRFYMVPGWGHGQGPFTATFDGLRAIRDWTEKGVAPAGLVAADGNPGADRTRPMCEYPAWPQYAGTGSVDSASSFTCVTG